MSRDEATKIVDSDNDAARMQRERAERDFHVHPTYRSKRREVLEAEVVLGACSQAELDAYGARQLER
jgi:hypothetical protein